MESDRGRIWGHPRSAPDGQIPAVDLIAGEEEAAGFNAVHTLWQEEWG